MLPQKVVPRPVWRSASVPPTGRRRAAGRKILNVLAGTDFDVVSVGRAGSPGCVNSGRRWHRRIPSAISPISRGHSCLQRIAMNRSFFRLAGSTLALALMLSGCALAVRRPSVAELKYNPGRYQDRKVSIDGVVTSSWGVPLVPLRFLQGRRRNGGSDGGGAERPYTEPRVARARRRSGRGCRDAGGPGDRPAHSADRHSFRASVTRTPPELSRAAT